MKHSKIIVWSKSFLNIYPKFSSIVNIDYGKLKKNGVDNPRYYYHILSHSQKLNKKLYLRLMDVVINKGRILPTHP